jgi:hypothetical protein
MFMVVVLLAGTGEASIPRRLSPVRRLLTRRPARGAASAARSEPEQAAR